MIYWQPGGITFPPTLLPPSRGIACVVSCGMRERTSEAERQRGKDEGEKENCRFILEGGEEKKKRSSFPRKENREFLLLSSIVYPRYSRCMHKWGKNGEGKK